MAQDDLGGARVYDSAGDEIGKIEQTYADDDGTVRYARVKMGTVLAKHRLVPMDAAQTTAEGVALPYSKDAIEHAPDLPDDVNPLSGMVGEDLRGYYAGTGDSTSSNVSSPDSDTSDATTVMKDAAPLAEEDTVTTDSNPTTPGIDGEQAGQVRERNGVIEIPVVEERLVKQPVVTEVIRVRKTPVVTEAGTASADVRKEEVQVESEGGASVSNLDSPAGDEQ